MVKENSDFAKANISLLTLLFKDKDFVYDDALKGEYLGNHNK